MQITIKQKVNNEWQSTIHESETLKPDYFKQFIDTPTVCEAVGDNFKIYAIGQPSLMGKWATGKAVMPMEDFVTYLSYKLMETAIDLFTRPPESKTEALIVTKISIPSSTTTQETLPL